MLPVPLSRYAAEGAAPEARTLVPRFPIECFPALLQRFAEEGAAAVGCPVDFFGAAMLQIAGAAIGTSVVIAIKGGWQEPAILWVVIIGLSGDGKTPAMNAVCTPLYRLQEIAKKRYDDGWKAYETVRSAAEDARGQSSG